MIVLNLKLYEQSLEKGIYFADIASDVVEESGVRIVLCPPSILLRETAEKFSNIYAQHTDTNELGAFTGTMPAGALAKIGVKGSLVNHSEKRIPMDKVKKTIDKLQQNTLEALVCGENPEEIEKIMGFNPDYIAVEPPELIGSGISVSNSKPEVVTDSLKVLEKANSEIPLLCGAGVSNKEDVKKALELGSRGVLLANAFVKAKDHKEFLADLASAF